MLNWLFFRYWKNVTEVWNPIKLRFCERSWMSRYAHIDVQVLVRNSEMIPCISILPHKYKIKLFKATLVLPNWKESRSMEVKFCLIFSRIDFYVFNLNRVRDLLLRPWSQPGGRVANGCICRLNLSWINWWKYLMLTWNLIVLRDHCWFFFF